MNRNDIMARVTDVMRDIFDEDDLTVTEEMTADDIEEWDSTNHVRLMVAIEEDFGVRFESDEISAPETVGELVDMIQAKLDA